MLCNDVLTVVCEYVPNLVTLVRLRRVSTFLYQHIHECILPIRKVGKKFMADYSISYPQSVLKCLKKCNSVQVCSYYQRLYGVPKRIYSVDNCVRRPGYLLKKVSENVSELRLTAIELDVSGDRNKRYGTGGIIAITYEDDKFVLRFEYENELYKYKREFFPEALLDCLNEDNSGAGFVVFKAFERDLLMQMNISDKLTILESMIRLKYQFFPLAFNNEYLYANDYDKIMMILSIL